MLIKVDEALLKPLVEAVVEEVLAKVEADRRQKPGRLSYGEAEAAQLLGFGGTSCGICGTAGRSTRHGARAGGSSIAPRIWTTTWRADVSLGTPQASARTRMPFKRALRPADAPAP